MEPESVERMTGYALLAIGLVFMLIAVIVAVGILLGALPVPQLVPLPAGTNDASTKTFALFSNACLIFLMVISIVWAGSIVTSRGLTIIKEQGNVFAKTHRQPPSQTGQ